MDNATRSHVENMLLAIVPNSVPSIGPALITGHDIGSFGQHVHYLPLPFIPPLQSENNIDWHEHMARTSGFKHFSFQNYRLFTVIFQSDLAFSLIRFNLNRFFPKLFFEILSKP